MSSSPGTGLKSQWLILSLKLREWNGVSVPPTQKGSGPEPSFLLCAMSKVVVTLLTLLVLLLTVLFITWTVLTFAPALSPKTSSSSVSVRSSSSRRDNLVVPGGGERGKQKHIITIEDFSVSVLYCRRPIYGPKSGDRNKRLINTHAGHVEAFSLLLV